VAVSLPKEALEQLQAKVYGRQAAKGGRDPEGEGYTCDERSPIRLVRRATQFFERLFVGGFEGDHFRDGRARRARGKGKAGYKQQPSRWRARSWASRALKSPRKPSCSRARNAFWQRPTSCSRLKVLSLWCSCRRGPPEGAAGLKQLLHGEGDYALRLEKFASSVNLKDKSGKGKAVTWPLATVFGALYHPTDHTCVKPTAFAAEGATLGLALEKSQAVTANGYRQFLKVARETQKRLLAAGHRPRDLVDVYTFIWRTHAEKLP